MTPLVLVATRDEASRINEGVTRERGGICLDGCNAVPHDLKYLCDYVHLHDVGAQALAAAFAEGLLRDAGFQELAALIRNDAGAPPGAVPAPHHDEG